MPKTKLHPLDEIQMQYSRGQIDFEEMVYQINLFKDECEHQWVSHHPGGTCCCDCFSDLKMDSCGDWVRK